MEKAIKMTKMNFESSCQKTELYLAWHRLFKAEFTRFLVSRGIAEIEIKKPSHFNFSGFFKHNDQAYYFCICDLRWNKSNMLFRTAKDFKDYQGGINDEISLESEEVFAEQFDYIVK